MAYCRFKTSILESSLLFCNLLFIALLIAWIVSNDGNNALSVGLKLVTKSGLTEKQMIPASIYNGNRNRIVNRGYAEGLDPQDYLQRISPDSRERAVSGSCRRAVPRNSR